MNRQRCPKAKLLLREMEHRAQWREDQKRDGIEDEDRAERYRGLFLVRVDDWRNSRYGTAATDCGAHGYEGRGGLVHPEKPPGEQAKRHGKSNTERGVNEAAASRTENLMQIHAEAESDYGSLQEIFGSCAAFRMKRVDEGKSVKQAQG